MDQKGVNMKKNIKTDLACERERPKTDRGWEMKEEAQGICRLHTLVIKTAAAARAAKTKRGTYTTLHFPLITTLDETEEGDLTDCLTVRLQQQAAALLNKSDMTGRRILVIGLGNRAYTADALGPLSCDQIYPTAQLRDKDPALLTHLCCAELAVFCPGVASCSGIDSISLAKATAELFQPELTLVIDALAARAYERLASTIQLTDTGIAPGTGLGRRQDTLDAQTLGCPILAIGAPTVIDTGTLIRDIFAAAGKELPRAIKKRPELLGHCYVCQEEADNVTAHLARVIAGAINRAFGLPDIRFLS